MSATTSRAADSRLAHLMAATEGAPLRGSDGIALVANRVTKRWRRGQEAVLDGVDFELPAGAIVALQGANGAGKTTLLRILAGLFQADSGMVSLNGLDPVGDRRAFQSQLGFLAAGNGGLYARLSVKQHLEFWARLSLLPRELRRAAVITTLGRFDLAKIASNRVDRLSMGQRQRVRLSMAFMHEPKVVLLDEPRNSLDENGVELLVSVLREFTANGGSVVWCAPSVSDTDLQFDALHELVEGKLVRL